MGTGTYSRGHVLALKRRMRVQPAAKEEREREREQIARWISINNVYFTIMFSSPNPCRRIVKPRTSRGVRHTGAGEPVSRYRFTFYREFNNGQPDPVEQNALIMRHEIVPMKIKRGWLPTLDDVKQDQCPWDRARVMGGGEVCSIHLRIVSQIHLGKIRSSIIRITRIDEVSVANNERTWTFNFVNFTVV